MSRACGSSGAAGCGTARLTARNQSGGILRPGLQLGLGHLMGDVDLHGVPGMRLFEKAQLLGLRGLRVLRRGKCGRPSRRKVCWMVASGREI